MTTLKHLKKFYAEGSMLDRFYKWLKAKKKKKYKKK